MRKKNSQMSGLTAVLAVLATVALVLAAQIGLFTLTGDQVKWPEFPAAEKTAPPAGEKAICPDTDRRDRTCSCDGDRHLSTD